jgi:hypothetical protein
VLGTVAYARWGHCLAIPSFGCLSRPFDLFEIPIYIVCHIVFFGVLVLILRESRSRSGEGT